MIQIQNIPLKFTDKENRTPSFYLNGTHVNTKLIEQLFKSNQLQWGHLDTKDVHRAETISAAQCMPKVDEQK